MDSGDTPKKQFLSSDHEVDPQVRVDGPRRVSRPTFGQPNPQRWDQPWRPPRLATAPAIDPELRVALQQHERERRDERRATIQFWATVTMTVVAVVGLPLAAMAVF